jgi:hypothetical protein
LANMQTNLSIRDFAHLAQVVQEAEQKGEQVVFLEGNSVRVVKYNSVERAANKLSGQSERQAASLERFATSLRDSELKARGVPLLDRDSRIRNLVGKTIEAKVASSFLTQSQGDHALTSKINFDGTGRIIGVSEDAVLGELELFKLESAIIQDLRATNASGVRTAARTESECVLEALGLLNKAQLQHSGDSEAGTIVAQLQDLEAPLKALWLSGRMTQTAAQTALDALIERLRPLDAALADKVSSLSAEVAKPKVLTQRHDNTFGRVFETALAKHLADHPTPHMLQTAAAINKFLLRQALTPRANQTPESDIQSLAEALKKDARPWHAEVPEIQDFLNEPTEKTLRALLERPVTNGYQMMTTYWMAAKVSVEMAGPWMPAADENYSELIKPSRSSEATPLSATGITHVAKGAAAGSKILERIRTELLRPGFENTVGMSASEVRALYSTLELLDDDLHVASGSARSYGQTLPPSRDMILDVLSRGQKLLADKFPHTAQQLQDVHDDVLSGGTLEVGSEGAGTALLGHGAQGPSSDRYGTGLLYQPKPEVPHHWRSETHIPSRTGVNVTLPTSFEQNTLARNQNTVNGVSGTTNMLTFMLLYMQDTGAFVSSNDESLDIGDALMGNLTFLVMDGGHSIPEAMGTSTSILANTQYIPSVDVTGGLTRAEINEREKVRELALEKIRLERQQVLHAHVTDYAQLHEHVTSPSTQDLVKRAVADAFEKTRSTFDTVHEARVGRVKLQT